MDVHEARGQGSCDENVRSQGQKGTGTRCQGYENDDVRGQGLVVADTRGQGLRIGHTRGQESLTGYARGQGPTNDCDTRGQGSAITNDTRGQGSVMGCDTRGQGTSTGYDTRGKGYRNKKRLRRRRSSSEETDGTSGKARKITTKRMRRKRRHSSTSSESSGKSIKAHPIVKRTRPNDNINTILDKVLSLVRDVKSSDKHKLSFDKNAIPEFDPMVKDQTILTWINKVEECAEIYGWDERETIHYSLPKLSGVAKSWYQGLPSLLYTWSEWKKKLLESFPCREDFAELLTEMLGKRVRYGESLEQYYYAKINLLNRCKITGRQAVDCILHGVDDRAVRVGAQAVQFSEPEQLLRYFRTVKVGNHRENGDDLRRNRVDRGISNSGPNNKTQIKPSFSNPNIRCFNCNQQGHPSFKCDKPLVKCLKCDRLGHQTANCYKRNENSNNDLTDKNEKQVSELSVLDRANDKYIMDVCVNGVMFKCHLDLGSQCSLIRESDVKMLGINTITNIELPTLRGIGANLIQPLGMIIASVSVQDITESVKMYVVEDYVLRYAVLLGHTFTEKPNLIITKTPDKIIFERTACNEKVFLVSRSDTSIPVDGLRAIPVVSNTLREGVVYINGSVRGPEGKEYYLLPGEYNIRDNQSALLVHNASSTTINIKKDSLLTRAIKINKILNSSAVTISVTEIDDSIICNPNFSTSQRLALQKVLCEFKDCFSSSLKDLGFTNAAEMTIDLEDSDPVVYRPYRMSHSERTLVREMVQDMIECGIARESSSPYASPIVLVKKKTGEKRLCVDYRALNRKTKKDHYPLPRIEDQLDLLSGNNLFTSLDLASGYYQIPIGESSRHKTSFVTPDGQFEYNRMPFGLVNAPAVFQRTINKILAEAKIKYALIYMDDILIPSRDFDEGLVRLREVLGLLRKGGLTLKMSKCNFFLDNIDFLGFEVSANGIRPGLRKTEAISKFPKPKNQHELRQFLGLSGFFRRFIKNYAIITAPLSELLKKEQGWAWTEERENAFTSVKELLSSRPLLSLYNPQAETQVHTDASKYGLAGILLQRNSDGVWQPISYFSRKTTKDEQNYHSFELETLAIIASLNRFRVYLIGIPFTIQTDCNAIRSTLTKRDLVPRIARWWIQLQEFDCSIEYRPGAKMSHVDALSRNPVDTQSSETHILDILSVESEQDWIATVQLADSDIARIKDILNDPDSVNVVDVYKNYKIKNNHVYRIVGEEIKWVVPKGARWQILKRNHDDVGHYGYEKTLERIRKHYWFSKMRRFVKKYVTACLECAHHKAPGGKREGELHPIEKISIPFHTIHADHLGPFVRSKRGNCYLLVIIDGFTKFINIKPVKNTKTLTTIRVLKDHISFFGVPTRLITDRGSSFTCKAFKQFTSEYGIKHILNAVATPRANGQVERFNRTITEALATSNHGKDEKSWDECINAIQLGLNTTVHKITLKSPSELLFGFNINHQSQGMLSTIINETTNVTPPDELGVVRDEASGRMEAQQQKDVARYNSRRKICTKYSVGDLVRIERQAPHDGKSQKLVVKYQGPYRILKLLPNDRFVVEDTPLSRKNCRRYEGIVAIDKIQPWMSFDRNFDNSSNIEDIDKDDDDNDKDDDANDVTNDNGNCANDESNTNNVVKDNYRNMVSYDNDNDIESENRNANKLLL